MHTRIISIGTQLFFLRLFFNIKVLPDFRGIGESEYNKNQKHPTLNTLNNYLNNILLSRFSDSRFFVSKQLKSQYYSRFKINLINNYIFPCAADSNTYYFDQKLRDEKRSDYGLNEQDIVFLYSGKLDKPWQIPDCIFSFFVSILDIFNSNYKIKLFLLTPDETIAREKQNRFNITDDLCIIREADTSELNNFYNLADFGLLFRKIHIVNETASPTKFAEYLLAGLPVLITEKIGDYSELINKNKIFGRIIKWDDGELKVNEKVLENIISLNQLNNRHILSDFAKKNLSKQYFLTKIIEIFNKV